MTAKKDCCVGEPCMGDPGGMHSLDCPVYLASMEALEARRPKLAQGGFVFNLPGGESTAAALDRVEQELRLCKQRAADLEQDRNRAVSEKGDLVAVAAGQARRLHAAYEALYIEEFDGDSCPDLEATIEYAIGAYRRVCASEAAAADQIDLLRAELATARTELERLRIQLAGVVQFATAWQGQKPPCPHGRPGGERCGPCSFDRAIPDPAAHTNERTPDA